LFDDLPVRKDSRRLCYCPAVHLCAISRRCARLFAKDMRMPPDQLPVQVPEYVLVSEELYQSGGAALFAPVNELSHDLEGIGPVRTYHVDIAEVAGSPPAMPDPRLLERLGRTVDVAGRGLPYMLGLRRRRRVAPGN